LRDKSQKSAQPHLLTGEPCLACHMKYIQGDREVWQEFPHEKMTLRLRGKLRANYMVTLYTLRQHQKAEAVNDINNSPLREARFKVTYIISSRPTWEFWRIHHRWNASSWTASPRSQTATFYVVCLLSISNGAAGGAAAATTEISCSAAVDAVAAAVMPLALDWHCVEPCRFCSRRRRRRRRRHCGRSPRPSLRRRGCHRLRRRHRRPACACPAPGAGGGRRVLGVRPRG